jgi:hypothetical protein
MICAQFICQTSLTMIDSPVSALVLNAPSINATSATSETIANSLSTVSPSKISFTTRSSEIPNSCACCGICFTTSGVGTKPGQITLAHTAMGGAFFGYCVSQAKQAVFRRHRGGFELRRLVAVHGAHVNQSARFLRIHVFDAGFRCQKRVVKMDDEHLFPIEEGKFFDRMHNLNAGVGHDNVDRPESLRRRVDAGVDLLFARYVRGDRHRRLVTPKLLRRSIGCIEIEIGDGGAATRLDVALGDAEDDAAGGASDESDFPFRSMLRSYSAR